jgi:DNA-binding transcriptional LysR family regulator
LPCAGSIAGAADRLFRTPSAITRQLKRLEAELGAELLDRSTKPPRLNSAGAKVLGRARDLLQATEALRSLASPDAEPRVAIWLSSPGRRGRSNSLTALSRAPSCPTRTIATDKCNTESSLNRAGFSGELIA